MGGAGRLATLMETVAPRQFERTNRRYVDRLQFAAEPAPVTDGNLYAPVSDGLAETRGGWRRSRLKVSTTCWRSPSLVESGSLPR